LDQDKSEWLAQNANASKDVIINASINLFDQKRIFYEELILQA
jgi:hypothetical protein